MAKMGLSVRDDPPRVIDIAARQWGEVVDGFALSIEQIPREATLSVVLRNVGTQPRTLVIPGWLGFFKVETEAQPTRFGLELMKPERQTERINSNIGPGGLAEAQIPVASLFALQPGNSYPVRVSCTLPGGKILLSNAANFLAPGTYRL